MPKKYNGREVVKELVYDLTRHWESEATEIGSAWLGFEATLLQRLYNCLYSHHFKPTDEPFFNKYEWETGRE